MSTSLQNYWRVSDNYEFLSANQIINASEKIIEAHHPNRDGVLQDYAKINFDPPALPEGKTKVISEEAFSFSFLHSPELASYIPAKQEFLANLISEHASKVLLMVRNPIDWIASTQSQQIKEGGFVGLRDYLNSHRDIILANLDLKALKEFWTKSGAELVILPIELARSDEPRFWQEYEKRLGFDRPSNMDVELGAIGENKTIYETVDIHRTSNELLSKLEGIIDRSEFKDKDNAKRAIDYTRRWSVRRALTFAEAEDIKELETILGIDDNLKTSNAMKLDQDFADQISDSFISVLADDDNFNEYGCLEGYQEKLSSVTS